MRRVEEPSHLGAIVGFMAGASAGVVGAALGARGILAVAVVCAVLGALIGQKTELR